MEIWNLIIVPNMFTQTYNMNIFEHTVNN